MNYLEVSSQSSIRTQTDAAAEEKIKTEICKNKLVFLQLKMQDYLTSKRKHRMHLTATERSKAWKYIYSVSPEVVLITKFNIQITGAILNCLAPLEWCNDEVINFYMNILHERNQRQLLTQEQVPKTFFWSTFFYTKLVDSDDRSEQNYNYENVQRWTKRRHIDVFDNDLLLIPIHLRRTHWTLGVVNLKEKKIHYLDSMNGTYGNHFSTNILRYLMDEHMDKKKIELPFSDTYTYHELPNVPQQANGSDCGIFVCQFCECLSDGRLFDFKQKDILDRRLKMAVQIVSGKVD